MGIKLNLVTPAGRGGWLAAAGPMRHRGARLILVAVAVVAGAGLMTGAAQAPRAGAATMAGSGWGNAEKVLGLAAHFTNTHWSAAIKSLSCASPGNCSAGGYYQTELGGGHAVNDARPFLVSQQNGQWGRAVTVPGITALSRSGDAELNSVSCTKGGCAAGGFYTDAAGHLQGFLVGQRKGRWQTAFEVPGLAALNAGESAQVSSVSCPSAGNCTTGGTFTDYRGHVQGFVANERDGRWRPALAVPGLTKLNAGGNVNLSAVRCASAGNCAAGGQYGGSQPFVVSEHDGIWSNAIEVPGMQAINTGDNAAVATVSCPSPGNCSAGGYYWDNNYDGPFIHPWVVGEKDGSWGKAVDLGGSPLGLAGVRSVSCPSAGNCVAAGVNSGTAAINPAWVITETNFRWGTPMGIAGTGGGNGGYLFSVSCPSVGNCGAGGISSAGALVSESHGRWGKMQQVPGITALGGGAEVTFVSCPLAGECTAAGSYGGPRLGTSRPFVVSQVK